jgi:hypothetical protein
MSEKINNITTANGVTIVKVKHPEFFLDLKCPTNTYYGYYPEDFFHGKKLKAIRVLSYTMDYKSRLSELGKGDFIYVLHRFGEDEYPNRYNIVTNERLTCMRNK